MSSKKLRFFFSSRSTHTGPDRDRSSDVCSSDLWSSCPKCGRKTTSLLTPLIEKGHLAKPLPSAEKIREKVLKRSEERRVGKEGRSRRSARRQSRRRDILGEADADKAWVAPQNGD